MDTTKSTIPTGPRSALPPSGQLPAIPGYEVLALVGRGGMGKVYRARHLALGRTVAIKLLAGEPDEMSLARFREEARAVARLQHPNIAQLFETGVADGQPYYAQEFVEGGSLAQLYAGEPQEPRAAARLVETVARAVQHSHENGILHRDLKPGNILLAPDGTPKVADFGLAKNIQRSGEAATVTDRGAALTRTGEILGTPGYMPPEQATGALSDLGPATDVYALGAILYEALTGRPPFQSPDPIQTVLMVLSMDPVPPRRLQPKVPRDLETICLKCLQKNPKKRYGSAKDLADDLRRFLAGEPIVARPVGLAERLGKWARRRPWQAAAAAMGAFCVLGLIAGLIWVAEKNRQVRDANDQLAGANTELERANANLTAAKAELERANTDVTAQKENVERTLGITLHAIDRYYFDFSDRLRDLPGGEGLRREVLDNARGTLDRINRFLPESELLQRYRLEGYGKLGDIAVAMEDAAGAKADYEKARDIAAALETKHPGDDRLLRDRALLTTKLATLARRRGEDEAADAMLDGVVPVMNRLAAAHPEDISVMELESLVRLELFNREARAGHWNELEPRMRQMCDLARRQAKADPDNPQRAMNVIDWDTRLAILLLDQGQRDGAVGALTEARRGLARLTDTTSLAARKLRARVDTTAGTVYQRDRQYLKAFVAFAAAHARYKALADEFAKIPMYRYQQAESLFNLGSAAVMAGDEAGGFTRIVEAEKMLAELTREHKDNPTFRALHERVSGILRGVKKPPKQDKG